MKIHCVNSQPILSLISLKSIEEKMPASKFVRVHRSFIIALDKIESIEKHIGEVSK